MIPRPLGAALLGLLLLSGNAAADFAPSAPVPPRAKAGVPAAFRAEPTAASTRSAALEPADARAIDKARAANSGFGPKRLQVGFARRVPDAAGAATEALPWQPAAGGWVAHLEIRSPEAKALRLGLVATRITPRVELRMAGSARPGTVYGPFAAADLAAGDPVFWGPVLEGERATLEVFVGAGGAPDDVSLAVVRVSHLFANPFDVYVERDAKNGLSQSCEQDLVCRSATDAALANTGKAVARMLFQDGPDLFYCTGTLLSPTNGPFDTLFYTANHCIGTPTVAATLTTLWFYDRPLCNSGIGSAGTQLTGGATVLYANEPSDASLLRLNALPPAGAVYAGWESATLFGGTPLTAVHHPSGDWKKVSLATVGALTTIPPGAGIPTGSFVRANWLGTSTGVTEGGSSGSGIFTAVGSPATDYRLRGGLWGGPSSCAAPPASLHDYYSRFDAVYPSIATYLNAPNTTGTLQFAATGVGVEENAGSAVLQVTRTGGSTGGVFVDFTTGDLTANAGQDFTTTTGSLYWGPGDSTPRSITVPIVRDAVDEPTEAFTVTLSNPRGGAALGAAKVASVAIIDPGPWPPGGAPPAGFVQPAGAPYGWVVASDTAYEGAFSLKSAMPQGSAVGTKAVVEVTATTGAGTLRFARKVSGTNPLQAGGGQPLYDGLLFFIDGVQMCQGDSVCTGFPPRYGEIPWGEESYLVSAGTHAFRWEYVKNNPGPCTPDASYTCADTAWIDAVRIPVGALPAVGDFDDDGIPNAVEAPEGRNPYYKDNDVFAANATGARLFAMQQYRDFLGREADPGGLDYYTGRIASGAATRAQVAEAFFLSPEFQDSGAAIVRLYAAFFGRIPDHEGFAFQADALRSGTPLAAIANNFSLSPEFVATYGALDDAQYVALLYQNVLGRTPAQAEIDYHVARLAAGVTRGEVMTGFSESPEYRALKGNGVYVVMMYEGLLRRAAEMEGFLYWVNLINQGMPGVNLIQGFIDSAEYRARFLP